MIEFRFAAALLLAGAAPAAAQPAPPPPAAQPAAAPDFEVAPQEGRRTAEDLAAKLETRYVFPDVAARYAAALRANAAAGAYDGLTSGRALAERLTADLRAVSPDRHLRVGPRRPRGSAPASAGAPGSGQAAPAARRYPAEPIEEARWLAPGIAYIRFNLFPGDPGIVAAVAAFMREHANAKTIIFDNRTHHGGGLDEMDAIFPWLFARPTALLDTETRAEVERAEGAQLGNAKLRLVAAPPGVVRREHYVEPTAAKPNLSKAKVFVLTSGVTASAGEHMALALKRTHRATLIGERTAGAGHYGHPVPIGDKFAAFIPVGRTFDPSTGKDWEGTGIDPDVAVPAAQALTEALVRSGLARAEAERISAEVKPTGSMTPRTPPPS